LPTDASYADFRSAGMKLAWLMHSRPYIAYIAASAAQVTESRWDHSSSSAIRRLNSAVSRLKAPATDSISFPKLDIHSLLILVFLDASFSNNVDLSSIMGYISFLLDNNNRYAPLTYKSMKCKGVTRSVLAAEAIALAEGYEAGYALSHSLSQMLSKRVPLTLLTDSKTLFDVVINPSYKHERQILIDLASVREGYRRLDINDIGLISSEENLADGFTKDSNMTKLCEVVRTGTLRLNVKQFVIRDSTD
jgi:hypothetical protein